MYISSSLLIQAEEQGSSPSMNSQVGGFAAMAGIDMGSSGQDKSTLAIATLESRDFLRHLLAFDGVAEGLLAAISFDPVTKNLEYEESDFDPATKPWIRKAGLYETVIPSALEVYESYRNTLSASVDKKTGFINISVNHISPYFAYDFLNLVLQ